MIHKTRTPSRSAFTSAGLVLAGLAMLGAGAGVGYAAGQIGTAQIKNNAITTPKIKNNAVTTGKIKNGTVKSKDIVKAEKQKKPTFTNGGQGDCVWQTGKVLLPGFGAGDVTYRKDVFGTVHLTGVAASSDGAGGDADCDIAQVEDGIAFVLPAGYIPATTQYLVNGLGEMIIAGKSGISVPGATLPPGAVYTGDGVILLDNVSFEPAGSKVVVAKTKAKGNGAALKPAFR
jgi:hypothetical protein